MGSAPIRVNNGFTADCCSPKLYWIPKNPKFISRMLRPLIYGLWSAPVSSYSTGAAVVTTAASALWLASRER